VDSTTVLLHHVNLLWHYCNCNKKSLKLQSESQIRRIHQTRARNFIKLAEVTYIIIIIIIIIIITIIIIIIIIIIIN